MKAAPMMMVMTPPMRWSTCSLMRSVPMTPKIEAVARTKTIVNPATNNDAAPATRHRRASGAEGAVLFGVSSDRASAPAMPAR